MLTGPEHSRGIPGGISRHFLWTHFHHSQAGCTLWRRDLSHESKGVLYKDSGVAGAALSFHQKTGNPGDDYPGERVRLTVGGLVRLSGHFCPAVSDGNDFVVDDDGYLLVLDALVDLQEEPDIQGSIRRKTRVTAFLSGFRPPGKGMVLA